MPLSGQIVTKLIDDCSRDSWGASPEANDLEAASGFGDQWTFRSLPYQFADGLAQCHPMARGIHLCSSDSIILDHKRRAWHVRIISWN